MVQLESGYLTVEVARLKQQLIAGFYLNRGYEFATVTHELANGVLTFTVNEGTLHEVRFTGNSRISRTELLSALDLKTADTDKEDDPQASDIYHRTLGQSKINQMRKRLSETNEHFKSIQNWRVQREGGKNIMVVEVEEQPLTKTSGFPDPSIQPCSRIGVGGRRNACHPGSQEKNRFLVQSAVDSPVKYGIIREALRKFFLIGRRSSSARASTNLQTSVQICRCVPLRSV